MRTLVHLSDLHLGRLDPALLDPLVSTIRGIRPDLVVVSGDFTQRATVREFSAARRFLDALDARSLSIPGNHDVPLWNVAVRFLAPLDRYKRFICADLEPEYRDDEIVVVGVNTARSFAWGEGRINQAQVDKLIDRLNAAPRDATRIVVTHHPFDLPPGIREERLLGRARAAMARLAGAGADLFLSGHLHQTHVSHSVERYGIAGHSALIVQAGTVSMRDEGKNRHSTCCGWIAPPWPSAGSCGSPGRAVSSRARLVSTGAGTRAGRPSKRRSDAVRPLPSATTGSEAPRL